MVKYRYIKVYIVCCVDGLGVDSYRRDNEAHICSWCSWYYCNLLACETATHTVQQRIQCMQSDAWNRSDKWNDSRWWHWVI